MCYVIPYKAVKKAYLSSMASIDGNSAAMAAVQLNEQITVIIRLLLQSVDVDETWYRARYPDVAEAIDDGLFQSAKQHFIESGYFEGRRPGGVVVSEEWYLNTYPDVAEGVIDCLFASGAEHFELCGYDEGRLPFPM